MLHKLLLQEPPSRWAAEKRSLYDHKGVLHVPVRMHTIVLVPEIPMAESGSADLAIVPFVPLILYWPGRTFIGSVPVSFPFETR